MGVISLCVAIRQAYQVGGRHAAHGGRWLAAWAATGV